MLSDLRYSLRSLSKNPGFAAAAILTVALGIGATTAIFSVVYNVALKPLPYGDPDRLVIIDTRSDRMGLSHALVGAANFRDWKEQSTVFEEMTLVRNIYNANLTGAGEPERVVGALITSTLFRALQIQPMIGRGFTEEEEKVGKDNVVILSNVLWKRRFGGDPNVIGSTVMIDSRPNTVVGVMGPGFSYPGRQFQLWRPLTINPDDYQTRGNYAYIGIGRLKPGVSASRAQAELDTISARLAKQYPETNTGVRGTVMPMLDDSVGGVRTALYALIAAVACLLLIGCANLANLLLARAVSRATELQVRVALGARRRRLIAQSVVEVLPIIVAGGILGALIAAWGLDALSPFLPSTMPRVEEIRMSAPVFGFTLLTLMFTALLAGILPALHFGKTNLAGALQDSFRGTSSGFGRGRLRDAIVVGQIATAIVLLIGSGLLVRSYYQLRNVDPGFESDHVLSVSLAIPRARYGKDDQVAAFCEAIVQRVTALPDVTSAGMVNRLPLGGIGQIGGIEGELSDGSLSASTPVDWRTATPDYFRTLGIPLVQGRSFTDRDAGQNFAGPGSTKGVVAIVDEQIAHRFWPNENPVGKRIRIGQGLPWTEVVGVVGHVQHDRLDQDTRPQVYWNYKQRAQDRMVIVVRTRLDPRAIESAVVNAVHEVDPDQPVYDVRLMTQVIDSSISQQWLNTLLLGIFASASLLLTGIGVYGVLSYSVGQRMREFGIRMALGAQRGGLMIFVLRQAALLTLTGAAIGVVGAWMLMRMMTTLLFGVSPSDRIAFGLSILTIAVVSLLAGLIPASRAANADPMKTLR